MAEQEQLSTRLSFLFQRYINDECDEKELTELLQGLQEPMADEYLDNISLSLWEAIKRHQSKTLTIEMKQELRAEARRLIYNEEETKPVYRLFNSSAFRKIAASIVLLICLGGAFYLFDSKQVKVNQEVEVAMEFYESGARQKRQISLPDGSKIYLNNDTKLGIDIASFDVEKREVWLEEGEAFFEVTKNPDKTFIVHSHNLETTVKGTSFNVKAYKVLDESSVSVRSGKVEVHNNSKLLGTLIKDRQIVFNKTTNDFVEQQASWQDAAAWMDNRLVMKQANTKELKLRLKQHFGVEVQIRGNVLDGKLLSCSFNNRISLKEVLEGLKLLYGINYDISDPEKVVISK